MGPDTVLSKEEELMENWIIDLSKRGFPRKRHDVLFTVKAIENDDKRPTPFKNGLPGKSWFTNFLKRHPNVVEKTSEVISSGRAAVSESGIRAWFSELCAFLSNHNLDDIMSDPRRVINTDESNFQLNPKSGKVLGLKGWKNFYEIFPGSEKETLTYLGTFSADGTILPGMVIYPYKKPPRDIVASVPNDWGIGLSDSGWMKSDNFFEYVLLPYLRDHDVPFPVILFVDGHKSHLTYQLSKFCEENGIVLYCLKANATHILQPADFKPLKSQWKSVAKKWRDNNSGKKVTKIHFAVCLKEALDEISAKTISNVFKRCGLWPLNPDAVDYSKCVTVGTAKEATIDTCERTKTPFQIAAQVLDEHIDAECIGRFKDNTNNLVEEIGLYNVWLSIHTKAQEDNQPPNQPIEVLPPTLPTEVLAHTQPEGPAPTLTEVLAPEVLAPTIPEVLTPTLPEILAPIPPVVPAPTLSVILALNQPTDAPAAALPGVVPNFRPLSDVLTCDDPALTSFIEDVEDVIYKLVDKVSYAIDIDGHLSINDDETSFESLKDAVDVFVPLDNGDLDILADLIVDKQTTTTDIEHLIDITAEHVAIENAQKKHLFYPTKNAKSTKKRKIDLVPHAVTSNEWRTFYELKDEKMRFEENEKSERKTNRLKRNEAKSKNKTQVKDTKVKNDKTKKDQKCRQKQKTKKNDVLLDVSDEDYFCALCTEKYQNPPTEDWSQCQHCGSWSHAKCMEDTLCGKCF